MYLKGDRGSRRELFDESVKGKGFWFKGECSKFGGGDEFSFNAKEGRWFRWW